MVNDALQTTDEKMKTSVKVFRTDLASIRTGHATPALVEHVKVDYGGTPMALNQIAGISAPEPGMIVIQPWDKTIISAIEKAILKTDLGLNPSSDGAIIRIAIPPLSEERRQELIKVVHKRVEERRVTLKLEKDKEISQDELKRAETQLQQITDVHIGEVESLGKDKENQLLEV